MKHFIDVFGFYYICAIGLLSVVGLIFMYFWEPGTKIKNTTIDPNLPEEHHHPTHFTK